MVISDESQESLLRFLQVINGPIIAIISTSFAQLRPQKRVFLKRHNNSMLGLKTVRSLDGEPIRLCTREEALEQSRVPKPSFLWPKIAAVLARGAITWCRGYARRICEARSP